MIGHVIEGGHVHALDLRQRLETLHAGLAALLPFPYRLRELDDLLLAVADHDRVHKIRQRFRIEGAGSAHTNDRIVHAALCGMQRHAAQLQHGQDIGIAHLVLQGEAHQIELIQGRAAFQRKQRHAILFHQFFHIDPRHTHALAQRPRMGVDDRIKNFHAKVRHGHLIGVREAEGEMHLCVLPRLDCGIHFAADITRRLLHLLDHFLDLPVKQTSILL